MSAIITFDCRCPAVLPPPDRLPRGPVTGLFNPQKRRRRRRSHGARPSLRNRLTLIDPHCIGCGIRLQATNSRLVNYAHVLSRSNKLACAECVKSLIGRHSTESGVRP